jgi:hypothetical protein
MKIIGIQKTSKDASQTLFLLDSFDELTFSQLQNYPAIGQLLIQIKRAKSGRKYVSARPNTQSGDNLASITIVCSQTDYLVFNGKTLLLKAGNGKVKKSWPAVSGLPGSKSSDQSKADLGPIPEGVYLTRFDKTLDIASSKNLWDATKWIVKSPSWGFIATPLEPSKTTNTFGRGDFYIHGGFFPGSKGCIDLTLNNAAFHIILRLYKRNLKLLVKYADSK